MISKKRLIIYVVLTIILSSFLLFSSPTAAAESEEIVQEITIEEVTREEKPEEETLPSPIEYLRIQAGSNAEVLETLIRCESGWQTEIKNKNSSATGLGQFINSTWIWTRTEMGRDPNLELRKDPYEMIDTLIYLWDNGNGWRHWEESHHCWRYAM
jgi:hypothetical protein